MLIQEFRGSTTCFNQMRALTLINVCHGKKCGQVKFENCCCLIVMNRSFYKQNALRLFLMSSWVSMLILYSIKEEMVTLITFIIFLMVVILINYYLLFFYILNV